MRPRDAAAQEHPLLVLQENISGRLAALSVLRSRRDTEPAGINCPPLPAEENSGVRAAVRSTPKRGAPPRRPSAAAGHPPATSPRGSSERHAAVRSRTQGTQPPASTSRR